MNKDTRLIFENYARSLKVAVADSSAGLPIGKKPFDEDAEISPKKLVKKISNLPMLQNHFEDEILRRVEDDVDELRFDPDAIEEPTAADLAIQQNLDKWSGPNPVGHQTRSPEAQKLLDTFAKDLAKKVVKEYIKKYAYEDAAKYRRDKEDKTGTVNPENFHFLPGGDVYVKDNIMRQVVPRALAPEKPEGRVVDYQWKEIADYEPKKVYWNPSYGFTDSDAAFHRMNVMFKELFGEGYDFSHFVDVLVNSGFEDPLKIMESLIKNPNIEKIRDLFARHDKWRTERKKEQLKRGSQEGEDFVTVKNYPNGFTWRQMISKAGCEREGALQDHCVGQVNPTTQYTRIFTLVDNEGNSHVTIQVGRSAIGEDREFGVPREVDDIQQIKGKKNSRPKSEYIPYIEDFISNKEGMPNAKFGFPQGILPGVIRVSGDGEGIGWRYNKKTRAYYPPDYFPSPEAQDLDEYGEPIVEVEFEDE